MEGPVQSLCKRRDQSETGNGEKNGAEPGRSRTRNSHLKALQYVPEGLNIVPLIRDVDNVDGSKNKQLRPITLLETP